MSDFEGCPSCGQIDAVRRVTAIVSGETVHQHHVMGGTGLSWNLDGSVGVAALGGSGRTTQTSQLAGALSAPPQPLAPRLPFLWLLLPLWLGIPFFLGAMGFADIGFYLRHHPPEGAAGVFLVPAAILGGFISIVRSPLASAARVPTLALLLVGWVVTALITYPLDGGEAVIEQLPFVSPALSLWILPYWLGLFRAFGQSKHAHSQVAMPQWQQAMARWQQSYYCGRCDGVYIPGSGDLVPLSQYRT